MYIPHIPLNTRNSTGPDNNLVGPTHSTMPGPHCEARPEGIDGGMGSAHSPANYTVSQKTCDYIFYNNFNNKCLITIIFGIVSGIYASSKDGFIFYLTYLVQLPYLGKSQKTKNDHFRRKQHIVL